MTWTLITDGSAINVRAIIDPRTQQDELRALIAALQNHLSKENLDATGSAVVRPGPAANLRAELVEEAKAKAIEAYHARPEADRH